MTPSLRNHQSASPEVTGPGAGQAAFRAALPAAERPKVESHHPSRREHHTNTGVRQVRVYQHHEHGLYVARTFVQHPRIRAWQAHLLPAHGLQICRYDFHAGREHDYYIDLATILRRGEVWELHDHYLDVLLWDGLGARLVDEAELHAAERAGYVGAELSRRVSAQAAGLMSDLGAHDFRLGDYLAALGVTLAWQNLSGLEEEACGVRSLAAELSRSLEERCGHHRLRLVARSSSRSWLPHKP